MPACRLGLFITFQLYYFPHRHVVSAVCNQPSIQVWCPRPTSCAATSVPGSPVLVVETSLSQSSGSVKESIRIWVQPQAAGGGGAALAVGLSLAAPPLPGSLRLDVYVAEAAGSIIRGPLQCGDGTGCRWEGDPRFFLWLPLAALMPGSASCVRRLWVSARIAAHGLYNGVRDFALCFPTEAMRRAMARLNAPWGAVPVDMCFVKNNVQWARLR